MRPDFFIEVNFLRRFLHLPPRCVGRTCSLRLGRLDVVSNADLFPKTTLSGVPVAAATLAQTFLRTLHHPPKAVDLALEAFCVNGLAIAEGLGLLLVEDLDLLLERGNEVRKRKARLLGLGLLLLGGGLLLGLLGRLLQGLTELVAGLDLEKLAGLDEVLELGGQNLLEVAGKLEVGAEVLGDGGDGRAVPVLEGQDGGLHHVLVLGVGGGGFRGHLCLLVCCRRRTVEWTSRAINPIKIKFEKKHIAQS